MTDEAKDPVRLVSSAEDSLLRDALRAGEAELGTSDQLAIVAAKLGPILGGGGIGGAGSGGGIGVTGASKGASSLLGGTTAKLAVSLGIGAVVVASAGYVAVRSPSGSIASSSVVSPATPALAASSVAAPVLDDEPASPPSLVEPAPVGSARPATSASPPSQPNRALPVRPNSVASPSPSSGVPENEVRTLQRAQDALRTEPSRALSICDDHARRFPSGLLDEEREVIAIDALTRLGRTDDALARARRFREAHPSSSHLGRIEVLVGKGF